VKRAYFLILAALAVIGAACGDLAEPYAAKVNGTRITQDVLDRELRVILDHEEVRAQIEQGLGPGQSITGKGGEDTVTTSFTATVLTRRVFLELIHQEVEKRELRISDEDLDQARAEAEQQFGDAKIFAKFPKWYQDDSIRSNAEVAALQANAVAEVTDEDIAEYYEANINQFKGRCISHILVDTKEQVDQLRAQIEGGAKFADVAQEQSKDTNSGQQGGFLGCFQEGEPLGFVEPFKSEAEKLPVGQLSQPVQTEFGFHLITVVAERALPDVAEELRAQLTQQQGQSGFNELLISLVKRADIEVNPRYGRFSKDQASLGVIPPDAPRLAPTTTVVEVPGLQTPQP
jgi:parvulin-like peptidyl-prolyl isomerase